MANFVIRDVPPALHAAIKEQSEGRGQTMRTFIVNALEKAVGLPQSKPKPLGRKPRAR